VRQRLGVVDLLGLDAIAVVAVCDLPTDSRRFGPESVECQRAVLGFQAYLRR